MLTERPAHTVISRYKDLGMAAFVNLPHAFVDP